jgi:AcrR family transcriptional regulator
MTPRKRSPLTREQVVDTALRIVDEEGLEALSMRRLGAALGVEAMALYRHVPNKEALLDRTVERMRSELRLEEPYPEDPSDLLATIFLEYRRVMVEHPNMVPLAARRTGAGFPSGLEYLIEQGLERDAAVGLYQSLLAFTIGFSVLGAEEWGSQSAGVAKEIADRLGQWSDDTFRRTLKVMLDGYLKGEQR